MTNKPTPEIPAEELERIKNDAENYRLKALMGGQGLSIFPAEVYAHAAKAEYLRHLSGKPSTQPSGQLRWVKALLAMAEDGYKRSEYNGAHSEFLSEDRKVLQEARAFFESYAAAMQPSTPTVEPGKPHPEDVAKKVLDKYSSSPSTVEPAAETEEAKRLKYLEALINSPEIDDFLKGVRLESAHQTERWSLAAEENKMPHHYACVMDKLKGKMAVAIFDGNIEKYKHHLITLAAVCFNVHRQIDKPGTLIHRYFHQDANPPSPPSIQPAETEKAVEYVNSDRYIPMTSGDPDKSDAYLRKLVREAHNRETTLMKKAIIMRDCYNDYISILIKQDRTIEMSAKQREALSEALKPFNSPPPIQQEAKDSGFYCTKPSQTPCHVQCDLCKKHDSRTAQQEAIPEGVKRYICIKSYPGTQIDEIREYPDDETYVGMECWPEYWRLMAPGELTIQEAAKLLSSPPSVKTDVSDTHVGDMTQKLESQPSVKTERGEMTKTEAILELTKLFESKAEFLDDWVDHASLAYDFFEGKSFPDWREVRDELNAEIDRLEEKSPQPSPTVQEGDEELPEEMKEWAKEQSENYVHQTLYDTPRPHDDDYDETADREIAFQFGATAMYHKMAREIGDAYVMGSERMCLSNAEEIKKLQSQLSEKETEGADFRDALERIQNANPETSWAFQIAEEVLLKYSQPKQQENV